MIRIFLFLVVALSSFSANAFNYNRWFCDFCALPQSGTVAGAQAPGEAVDFIKSNNTAIMQTGPTANSPTTRWVPNDTITICDGAYCITLLYVASGSWQAIGPTFKDTGRGYKNAQLDLKGGEVGNRNGMYTVTERVYTYSSPMQATTVTIEAGPITAVSQGLAADFSMNFNWGGATSTSGFSGETGAGGGGGGCGGSRIDCMPRLSN